MPFQPGRPSLWTNLCSRTWMISIWTTTRTMRRTPTGDRETSVNEHSYRLTRLVFVFNREVLNTFVVQSMRTS